MPTVLIPSILCKNTYLSVESVESSLPPYQILNAAIDGENTMFVAIGRQGYSQEVQLKYAEDIENGLVDSSNFLFIDVQVQPVSSTEIRSHLQKLVAQISMIENGNIEALNTALRDMAASFKADDDGYAEVHVAVITFGGD